MQKVRNRPPASWAAAAWSSACFLLLTVAVARGLLDGLDRSILAFVRPDYEWRRGQVAWNYVVDGFQPPVAGTLLAAVTVAVCVSRRSWRPAVPVVMASAVGAGATLLVKVVLARPDPGATGSGVGGSFPSGHTLGVALCAGLVVHLVRPAAPRSPSLVAGLAGAVMGFALVVVGAHWASDVIGGLLLGLAAVSAAAAFGTGRGRAVVDLSEGRQVHDRPVS
ncbi:MAG TPA: phosphatase PAP2 family protein [Kineosporiaceae bacterium]|nr:phosphatase PAP2 family protein [Kineosporiaceae bacterium]